jgi:general stress protein YciG
MARNNRNRNNQQGQMSVSEAGRLGGEKTSQTHDREFYENIGAEGGRSRGAQGDGQNRGQGGQFRENDEWTEQQARKGGEKSGGNPENLNNQ